MNVMVLGSGGREHVISRQLAKSPRVNTVFCSPGNGGMDTEFTSVHLPLKAPYQELISFVREHDISLVVAGPEAYLVDGVIDHLQAASIRAFGPVQEAARLEGSKEFAKEIMKQAGVPTADYAVFTNIESARQYLQAHEPPFVLKADGLAAGKGVIIAESTADALSALDQYFISQDFGSAGTTLVIEEFLQGQEATVLAFVDGKTCRMLPPSQDHKRIGEGDTGLNTGGMGVYSPVKILPPALLEKVRNTVIIPTIETMAERGVPYKGILYAGLMIKGDDLKVVEFNVRFGDPECQCVLPMLESDLTEVMEACLDGTLEQSSFTCSDQAACTVILSSGGYPGPYTKGVEIQGLSSVSGAEIIHAGTSRENDRLVTAGGRVLAVTARAADLPGAIEKVYAEVPKIRFDGSYYRRDIGKKGL